MRLLPILLLACCATKRAGTSAEPMTGALPGDRIPAFDATLRRSGGEEPFGSRATKRTMLYIVNSTTCPYCAAYVGRMRRIEDTCIAKRIDVVHIYPNRAETPGEKVAWHAAQGFRGGQILDTEARIAHLLEADRTPTAYLVDASGIIVYRGAIDDAPSEGGIGTPYLADAIEAHLAGKPIEVASTEPAG